MLAYCFDDSNHQNTLYYCLLLLSYCLLFKVIISNDHFAGIVLILAGQCVSAIQMIVEESFLKKKNFHPLQVSSLLDKKIKIVYFIDDFHVIFVFLFSFFVFCFLFFCLFVFVFVFFGGGGSLWFTLGVLQFVIWFSSKPYRDA